MNKEVFLNDIACGLAILNGRNFNVSATNIDLREKLKTVHLTKSSNESRFKL
jgi:hypothetical protein